MAIVDLGALRAKIGQTIFANVIGGIRAEKHAGLLTDVVDTATQAADWESRTPPTAIRNRPLVPDPKLPVLADADAARPASIYLLPASGANLPEAGLDAVLLTSAVDAAWGQLAHVPESGKSWYRTAVRTFTAWGAPGDAAVAAVSTPSDIDADGVYQIAADWQDRNIDPAAAVVARIGGVLFAVSGADWYWRAVGPDTLWSAANYETPAPRAILAADARYDVHPGEILLAPPGTPGNPDAQRAFILRASDAGDALTAYGVHFPLDGPGEIQQYVANGASQGWGDWRLIQPYRLELPTIGPFTWITAGVSTPAAGEMGQLNAPPAFGSFGQIYYNGAGANLAEIAEVFEDDSIHLVELENASAGKENVTIVVVDSGKSGIGQATYRFINYRWPDPDNAAGIGAWAAGDQITVKGGSPHLLVSRLVQSWTASDANPYNVPSTTAVEGRLVKRTGTLAKDIAGGAAVALTAEEGARASIEFTGARTADAVITLPATPAGPRLLVVATTGAYAVKVKAAGQADNAALTLDAGANLVLHEGHALRWPPPVRGLSAETTVSGAFATILSGCQADDWIRIMAWEVGASPGADDKVVGGTFRFGSLTTSSLGWIVETPDGNEQVILARNGANLRIKKGSGLTDTVKAIAGFER